MCAWMSQRWWGGGAWNPQALPGLVLWLDAADKPTLFQDAAMTIPVAVNTDPVGGWADKSGNNNDFMQAVVANKPAYRTAIQNGLDVVRLTSGEPGAAAYSDYLAEAGNAASLQVTTLSFFIAFRINASRTANFAGVVFQMGESTEGFRNHVSENEFRTGVEGMRFQMEWRDSGNVDQPVFISGTLWPLVTWYILEVTLTTGANGWKYYKNGTLDNSALGFILDTGIGAMAMGYTDAGHTMHFEGDIGEYLLYNRVLTDAERILVESYLGAKWGIPIPQVFENDAGASFGATNHGLCTANGAAFFKATGVDLSPYAGVEGSSTPYQLAVHDLEGKSAVGYIGAADQAETLGADLFDPGAGTFDVGTYCWWPYGANTVSNDANTLKVTYVNNGEGAMFLLRNATDLTTDLTVGKLYKLTFDMKRQGGGSDPRPRVYDGASRDVYGAYCSSAVFVPYTFYFVARHATDAQIYFQSVDVPIWIDNLVLYEVTHVGAAGVHIVSANGGATRNWASIDAGFIYNDYGYAFEVLAA